MAVYRPQKTYFWINGIAMPTPTIFHWTPPVTLGITGNGKTRYHPFWELTLTWDFLNFDEYSTLLTTYQGVISGTVQIIAPMIYGDPFNAALTLSGTGPNRFANYNNVIIDMPLTTGDFIDNNYFANVKMTVRRIINTRNGITAIPPLPVTT